jgi:phenylacetic acid degradation protein
VGIYAIDGLVPVVHPTAFVHPQASLVGDVIIGAHCYIGPHASLRGDFGRIVLADGANVQDGCVLHTLPNGDCIVERDGHIGHNAVLHGCRISSNAMVGNSAVVLDGAVIGESAMVAAMSFVKAQFVVPARTLVAGVPAKVVRQLSEAEVRWKSEGTRLYQELARRSLASLHEVAPLREVEPGRQRLPLDDFKTIRQAREA